MNAVRTIAWLAAIVYSTIPLYWLIVHPRPHLWRRLSRSPLLILGPLWALIWIMVGFLSAPWRQVVLYDTPLGWLAALPLFAAGFYLYSQSLPHVTTDQVLGRSELQPERHLQQLVTTGIRARVRHPIYLAHFCELLAWSVGTGLAVLYALTAFAIFTGVFMVRAEERELELRFGEAYRNYRKRVPAIIPRLG
jgi:protein-S-isoprenylcysteine O-methyltransferase Ste14